MLQEPQKIETNDTDGIQTITLGTFEHTRKKLLASDPCYETTDGPGQVTIECEPGTWTAKLHRAELPGIPGGLHNLALEVHHEWGALVSVSQPTKYKLFTDSGLQGFYSLNRYREPTEIEGIAPTWQDAYCNCGKWLLLPHGIIVPTSWGDGTWKLLVGRKFKRGLASRALILFDEELLDYPRFKAKLKGVR